jgi:hypothetical protein
MKINGNVQVRRVPSSELFGRNDSVESASIGTVGP